MPNQTVIHTSVTRAAVIRRLAVASALAVLTAGGAAGCEAEAARPGSTDSWSRTAPAPEHAQGSGAAEGTDDAKPAGTAGTAARNPAEPKARSQALLMASGARGELVRELQARLRELALFDRSPTGYYGSVTVSAVRSFQAGHGLTRTGTVDDRTWTALRALTKQPSPSALHPSTSRPLGTPDPRCLTGRVLCISKSSNTLAWMIDGKVISVMDVRFGSQYTPTREGTFSVYFKSRDHFSTIYKTPMPYALFFSGGQAVHYSADFAARGYAGASHGCVNVRDEGKIASLFAQTRTGDKVVVHR